MAFMSSMQRTIQGCNHRAIFSISPILERSCKELSSDTKCSDNNENDKHSLPEEPTTCCMSGCANCVWIEYAEQVTKLFEDGGEKAKELILEKVKDPNTRAFLMMELKNLANKS
ncbi:hypothetical protein L9F63_005229 [Diploptera punctata]|uniref:Oxidoreductase-like domain-containing protein n=1 Tax=Diploptera punctata TaxID=6984 RepID=A0AAD8E5Y6_DIPPU|nr:hypothetical protein L9F63_005229 [Diploptera punctata]